MSFPALSCAAELLRPSQTVLLPPPPQKIKLDQFNNGKDSQHIFPEMFESENTTGELGLELKFHTM